MYTLTEYAVCLLTIVAFGLLFFGLSVLVIFGRYAALNLITAVRKLATRRLTRPDIQVRHAFQSLGPNNHLHE
jgi:hypothetical protein